MTRNRASSFIYHDKEQTTNPKFIKKEIHQYNSMNIYIYIYHSGWIFKIEIDELNENEWIIPKNGFRTRPRVSCFAIYRDE